MKKIIAFTIAEIIIALTVVGVIAVMMMTTINKKGIDEDLNKAKVYQAFEVIQQASTKILATETTLCPEGKFIIKPILGGVITNREYEYAFLTTSGGSAYTSDVLNVYNKYIRFEKKNLNFCSYSNYCQSSNTKIKGGRIVGNIYIGFEVYGPSDIQDCPTTYYLPESEEMVTKTEGTTGKCWGNVYVDIDGPKGEGVVGKDVFIWGLGETGIAY